MQCNYDVSIYIVNREAVCVKLVKNRFHVQRTEQLRIVIITAKLEVPAFEKTYPGQQFPGALITKESQTSMKANFMSVCMSPTVHMYMCISDWGCTT